MPRTVLFYLPSVRNAEERLRFYAGCFSYELVSEAGETASVATTKPDFGWSVRVPTVHRGEPDEARGVFLAISTGQR